MSWDTGLRQQRQVALDRWVDAYTARFDQTLTAVWPDLVDRLQEGIDNLSWYDLTVGPGKEFNQRWIEPAVQSWVERHVQPLIQEASGVFSSTLHREAEQIQDSPFIDVEGGSPLSVVDVLKALTLPGGVLVGGGAVATAVTTATTWLLFTTIAIDWPLLIGGLLLGSILSIFGVYSLAHLKGDLQGRFKKQLLPKIKNAVLGEGVQHEGKHIPSLRDQLIRWVEETAKAAQVHLDKGG